MLLPLFEPLTLALNGLSGISIRELLPFWREIEIFIILLRDGI